MKNQLLILLCCTVVSMGGITLLFSSPNQQQTANLHSTDCTDSMTWRFGRIDSRYNIKKSTVKRLMEDVGKLWSDAVGKDLVQYSDSGEVAIHLIYSDEQQFTENEQQFARRLQREQDEYESLKRDYQQLSSEYETQLHQYNQVVATYNQTVNRFQQLMDAWKKQGDIPTDDQQQMQRKLNELRTDIQKKERPLKSLHEKVNSLSDRLNNKADQINTLILHYNDQFTEKRAFDQGQYIQVGGTRKINIYQYENIDKLRLVLAHEVGHALGLSHVQNPESVMFHLMEQQDAANLSLSSQDVEAITVRCGGS